MRVSRKSSRHIVPNPDGGWDVRAPDAARSSGHAKTKQEAIARAREILANAGGGEMVIHGQDGQIQNSTTVGRDVASAIVIGDEVRVVRPQKRVGATPERAVGVEPFGPAPTVSPESTTTAGGVLVDGVLIQGLSQEDAVAAVRLLRAAREQQFQNGWTAARGLLRTMIEADVELIPPASVEQARRLASVRKSLLATPVFTHETLGEVRGDANLSTTRTWVSRARERRKLFTVKLDGRSVIPAFQLTEAGATRAEYAGVLAPLLESELDGWTIWIWLTSPTPLLSGGIPERLVSDVPERVQRAAQRFAASRRSAA
jgi:hypothetical protein